MNRKERLQSTPIPTYGREGGQALAGITGQSIRATLAIGVSFFAVFLWGVCVANPVYGQTVHALPGTVWRGVLMHSMGGAFGQGMADQSPWLLARIGGIVAYIGVWASVVLGLAIRLRLADAILHRASIVMLHRLVALEILVFTALHVVGLLLDTYLHIRVADCLIPFTLPYRPLWTGLGTLAIYTCIAVAVTAVYARRVGYRMWRTIHYGSFFVFAAAFLHGLMSGSDSTSGWMRGVYMVTGASVAVLCGLRLGKQTQTARTPQRT